MRGVYAILVSLHLYFQDDLDSIKNKVSIKIKFNFIIFNQIIVYIIYYIILYYKTIDMVSDFCIPI